MRDLVFIPYFHCLLTIYGLVPPSTSKKSHEREDEILESFLNNKAHNI